ncbi:hypothetical protein AQUCO_09300046v1 [Aquilegia coerulea]|uniref:Uncharacterized protein n=1 Tax=Aquilegia coerulea TaxID=218851 RepID=A0A2G5C597_AQUCA|nr:hypothetical protein AQUCO_23000005v1 [Aquilegia coerulea]PIA26468.1 hypothetical protein AQUCO_09300046v1 [Aquilegia coerulea]
MSYKSINKIYMLIYSEWWRIRESKIASYPIMVAHLTWKGNTKLSLHFVLRFLCYLLCWKYFSTETYDQLIIEE